MTTRIKICGLKTPAAARAVSRAGADAAGFVFYEKSPRAVTPEVAKASIDALAPMVAAVGLFVDPTAEFVAQALSVCALDVLQFHGDEDAAFCEQFDRPYWKAVRMQPDTDLEAVFAAHPHARAFLLDAYTPGVPGGTGETFDWHVIPELHRPWILAGGLNPANVGDAIKTVAPPAVDVSGGVEAIPGEKSLELIAQFAAAVRVADGRGDSGAP
ncbi:MAG: phosphoribosylanthranilate isomerase [Pseudomonadota bacterium]